MTSILEEFAYGNISTEAQFFKKDSEYNSAMEYVLLNEQKLFERLGAEEKKIFQTYIDMQKEARQLTEVKHFVYGYRLGLTMTAEAFIGMDDLYLNGNE